MSARVSRGVPPKVSNRNNRTRNMELDVDLNVPSSDTSNEVGTSSHVPSDPPQVQASQQGSVPQVLPIDVDSFDDDVLLSSPRAFAEAKNNSMRNRTRNNVRVYSGTRTTNRNAASNHSKRLRVPTNQPIINCESYEISSMNSNSMSGNGKNSLMQTRSMAAPPPPPPDPTFNCPVCMGPLVEEMTTKCGHIFCKACLKKSISSQGKCPTCRRKVTMKDTIRIYLPATT